LKPINEIGPAAIISDFGNNNGLLIGSEISNWRDSGFECWEVATTINGREAGRGEASAFANGAIGSAKFLFELMAERGIELRPGQWISSGAVTGVHDVKPGERIEVRFDRWYEIDCKAVAAEPE
jgi:2-keto-4-pentenoate hydratase